MDLANLCRAAFNGLRSLNRSLEGALHRRPRYVIQMKVILPNPLYGTVHIGHRIFVRTIVVFRAQLPSHEKAIFEANHFLAVHFPRDFNWIVVFIVRTEVAKNFIFAYLHGREAGPYAADA